MSPPAERADHLNPPCDRLAWDSQFWGFGIAQVMVERLTISQVEDVVAWSRQHNVRCVYFLAQAHDLESVSAAEACGFRCVDVRITFERTGLVTQDPPECISDPSVTIRAFEEGDLERLQMIARESYRDTRFYYDQHFPRPLCDQLYETWITKSCSGGADAVLVAQCEEHASGYVTCHVDTTRGHGRIGLVGISEETRGRGIGLALMHRTNLWFARHGIDAVSVATQGRNLAARRLYQRAGYLTKSTALWLHWWNDDRPA
jgi:GNAT superfamily N-acetyltransferase